MKKIVLVDDEPLIKQHLRESIPWSSWGFEIVGDAANGQEARELCAALRPDIALIDITMPVMDGLTLLSHLNVDHPEIRCIMLTAHRDFNYAQQAIQLHACGYILKSPLQPAEVKEALERASRDIEMNQTLHQTQSTQQLLLHQYQYPLRRQYFDHILKGILAESVEIVQNGLPIGIRLTNDNEEHCLLVCQVDELEQYKQRYPRQDDTLLEFSMLEIVRETIQELRPVRFELFPVALGQFAILLQLEEISTFSEGSVRMFVAALSGKLEKPLRQYMDLQLTIAVSRPFRLLPMLRGCYAQCISLLPHRFYQHEPRPIFEAEATPFGPWPDAEFPLLRTEFIRIWNQFSQEAFDAWLLKTRNTALQWQSAPDRFREWIASLNPATNATPIPDLMPPWPDFSQIASLDQALARLTLWVRERDRLSQVISIRPEIAKAIQFINNHLHEELTLEIIAHEVQLSPSYLGQLFKKDIAASIVDYIMEQRIERAKRYMIGGDLRNYELADKVGFTNYSYFCTMFKKYTGMTPNQYRSSVKPQFYKE